MSKQDRNMLRIMGALSAGRKKKSSSFKNIPEQVIIPTKKRNKFNSPPRSSRLLLMHPIMEFTWYTYIYRQVWQLTCDYRVCWISRHKRMVSLPDTFWFPSMSDNRHNTHTHTPQPLLSKSSIQLPNNVIVKIHQVNQRIRWYKINYATSLLLFQTTLAGWICIFPLLYYIYLCLNYPSQMSLLIWFAKQVWQKSNLNLIFTSFVMGRNFLYW